MSSTFMPLTVQIIVSFFSWWRQGLIGPFEHLLPYSSSTRRVLNVVGSALTDSGGNSINDSDIDQINSGAGIYLLASSDQVMSKRISNDQRNLSLQDIAREVLPFDVNELVLAADDDQKHLYSIVEAELLPQKRVVEARGLRVVGVAFSDETGQHCFSELEDEQVSHRGRDSKTSSKVWLASILIASIVLITGISALSYKEAQRRSELDQEFARTDELLTGYKAQSIGSLNEQIEVRSAAQVIDVLMSLANSLTESADVDQLILTGNELLLDASAISATQVQANLDHSGDFASSEFVTSISRSPTDEIERFRLKAHIKEGQ